MFSCINVEALKSYVICDTMNSYRERLFQHLFSYNITIPNIR